MSLGDVRSARSSPTPDACPECDTGASVTSDLHKYQVACTCKPASVQYACADDPGPPAPAKTDTPPALPPRPPTNVLAATNRRNNASVGCNNDTSCRRRKYAWWCCGCGALAAALGGLLAAQHILLRAYTASPHHLETVPAAVPAAMLVLTGVCIMSLARRRNRYSYMIKVVGACCLVCALTCVLVTITTTVIHMNKLQTLKFCEYTKLTRTCTCYTAPPDALHAGDDDSGSRVVFEGVWSCGVVHGALHWCLRGVFALSVAAVLVCIFSCMLAYQLLSHERKKMYWEQLELRCRSLYRPPSGQPAPAAGRPVQNNCSCCAQCHTAQPAWDFSLQHRFWAPGRIGNLYSPNPGAGRKTSPWSWLPWTRGNSQNSRCRMSGVPQSGDSAYGFCETEQAPNPTQYDERSYPNQQLEFRTQTFPQTYPQNSNFPSTATNFPQNSNFPQTSNFAASSSSFPQNNFVQGQFAGSSYMQESSGETQSVWGPPPPYSPHGRSGSRHHLHQDPAAATLLHHHIEHRPHDHSHACTRNYIQNLPENIRHNPDVTRPEITRPEISRHNPEISRLNPELRMDPNLAHMYPNEELHMDPGHMYPNEVQETMERFNTLRGHLVPFRGCQRPSVSVGNIHRDCREDIAIECLHQKSASKVSDQSSDSCHKQGKENLGFQNDKHSPIRSSMQECQRASQNAESEVYFADVSSCCNADCCINPNVSALVGTIETHAESTSESDTGSFTLTRQQRPQPQVGSKRRPRQTDKHIKQEKIRDFNNSRLNEQLNSSMRIERMNDSRISDRMNDSRISDRINDSRITERMNDSRISERMNDTRISERINDSRISERINESRHSDRMNDTRISDRMSDIRMSDRMIDSRCLERMNESRESRINESRDRLNERERHNDTERNDCRLDRSNDSRDRLNEARINERDRLNESRINERERLNESTRCMNDSRINESRMINESRISDRLNETRNANDPRIERFEDRRMSDLNSSIRIEGSPKRSHISPLRMRSPKEHRSDKEFFPILPNLPNHPNMSPLSPNTEESLLSDEDRPETVYSNDEAKCLGPDSQYEQRGEKEGLKLNHHHCYSDTNTMDSGWQSGSEKQVTD